MKMNTLIRPECESALYRLQEHERLRASINENPSSKSEGIIAARLVMERLFQEVFRFPSLRSGSHDAYALRAQPAADRNADNKE
jgi:hypothetical protein